MAFKSLYSSCFVGANLTLKIALGNLKRQDYKSKRRILHSLKNGLHFVDHLSHSVLEQFVSIYQSEIEDNTQLASNICKCFNDRCCESKDKKFI